MLRVRGIYNGEIVLPEDCKFVRTATFYNGQLIDTKNIAVETSGRAATQKKIDENKSVRLVWHKMRKFEDTESAYREIEALSKIDNLFLKGGSAYIYEKMKIIISHIRPTSPICLEIYRALST